MSRFFTRYHTVNMHTYALLRNTAHATKSRGHSIRVCTGERVWARVCMHSFDWRSVRNTRKNHVRTFARPHTCTHTRFWYTSGIVLTYSCSKYELYIHVGCHGGLGEPSSANRYCSRLGPPAACQTTLFTLIFGFNFEANITYVVIIRAASHHFCKLCSTVGNVCGHMLVKLMRTWWFFITRF